MTPFVAFCLLSINKVFMIKTKEHIMDQSVYKKMRLKEHTVGKYINAPKDYINMAHQQTYINFEDENPIF